MFLVISVLLVSCKCPMWMHKCKVCYQQRMQLMISVMNPNSTLIFIVR